MNGSWLQRILLRQQSSTIAFSQRCSKRSIAIKKMQLDMYERIQQVNLRPDPEMDLGSVTVRLQHLRVVKCLLEQWNLCNGGNGGMQWWESWYHVYQMGIVHPCNRLRTYSLLCMRRSLLQQVGVYQILLTLLLTSLLQLVVSCFIIVLLGPRKKKKLLLARRADLHRLEYC